MSGRFTQSRAETQRHQQILREELKRPENKLCADCKRNDPRWASTNLGVFVCIRCSGIHRSLGVHISRIKSIDLDTWTPEQVANVQRWGNKRANVYWEKHLKPGHVPPDHKIESFIRSKYESRRWAMEGPVPDPETLDGDANGVSVAESVAPPPRTSSAASASAPRKAAATTSIDLLSAAPSTTRTSSSSSARSTPAQPKQAQDSLFDLDFGSSPSAPSTAPAASPAPTQPKRDPKADILSLFNAAPPPQPVRPVSHAQQPSHGAGSGGGLGGLTTGLAGLSFGAQPSASTGRGADPAGWGASTSYPAPASQARTGLSSSSSFGDFGGFSSAPSAATPHTQTSDPWASSTTTSSSSSIWGNSGTPAVGPAVKANDPFAEFGSFSTPAASGGSDIWASSGTGSDGGAKTGGGAGGFGDIWG
ncbi:arf GTPase activating protein [Rhodotorula toruloides]|uniref:Arf GTPase activating protein n=1 Tax=Rhodotorula toruloides TaxID=5286 RepID=A0A511KBM0_RHOTO|nr:arf GTPase activating protein [Rhodotorula toruloides]